MDYVFQDIDFASSQDAALGFAVHIYGVTREGETICVNVLGFRPYFYADLFDSAWDGSKQAYAEGALTDFVTAREVVNYKQRPVKKVKTAQTQGKNQVQLEVVTKTNLCAAHRGPTQLLRVSVAAGEHVGLLRNAFERNEAPPLGDIARIETYESNLSPVLRFMIDKGIQGMSWITVRRASRALNPRSTCAIEIDVDVAHLEAHNALEANDWRSSLAPMCVLSVDIECLANKNSFPDADRGDPVIQIASVVRRMASATTASSEQQTVFVLGSCDAVRDATVHSFATEHALLDAWAQFVAAEDPDILLGYNLINFDLPYLAKRCEHLKVRLACTRVRGKLLTARVRTQTSAQQGARETHDIDVPGRVVFDMLPIIRGDVKFKLRSYNLNSVSAKFIGEQKEDLPYYAIGGLHRGNAQDRARIGRYCLKDAQLPLMLLDKLQTLYNMAEMARVTGVPVGWLLTRGQAIRVMTQICRAARDADMVVPSRASLHVPHDAQQYEGATVLEPVAGLHREPIATLDFASLYPSIMMAHNMCYSTVVPPGDLARAGSGAVTRSPSGVAFYQPSVRVGVLPTILRRLIAARARARAELKRETDPLARAVLDGRQMALKVSANSVYGFTGAVVGMLPCVEIAASVTAFGRSMIEATRDLVHQWYPGSLVVYGDTDSVMVRFAGADLGESMRLGQEAAGRVSETFPDPIRLEFEKCYHPFLLLAKKRYAGMKVTSLEKAPEMDVKGIETVRRDNCALVGQTMEACLELMLAQDNVPAAQQLVRDTVEALLQDRVDMAKLVISKNLSKVDYKSKQPHVELAARMAARKDGLPPVAGERVPYVIVCRGKDSKVYECSEDPAYALKNGIPLDAHFYITRQLQEPITRIFKPVMADPGALFRGEHTRAVKKKLPRASAAQSMMRFVKVSERCVACKVRASPGICDECRPDTLEIVAATARALAVAEKVNARLWVQCQRCSNDLHGHIQCAAIECPIFFMRTRAAVDLKEAQRVMQRVTGDHAW